MFSVDIKNNDEENSYAVFGEHEYHAILKVNNSLFLPMPNYYDCNVCGNTIEITNNEPVIIPINDIFKADRVTGLIDFKFGLNIDIDTYSSLYDLFLEQKKDNEEEEYKEINQIKDDIKYVKTLKK